MEVEVTGPNRDLHSGVYGGAVANPVNVLCKMIASCHDENNHITIPGFYDDVQELTADERKELAKAPFSLEDYKKDLDVVQKKVKKLEEARRFRNVHESKARIHTWLAWQKELGKPMGQAITARYLDANALHAQQLIAWIRDLFDLESA